MSMHLDHAVETPEEFRASGGWQVHPGRVGALSTTIDTTLMFGKRPNAEVNLQNYF